jgi:hypothetical protein
MASTYSDLKIELIGTGEQTGTWGSTTNNNFSIALSEAITGSANVAFSSADVTVTLTDTNAAQTARNLRLNLTGTSGGARQLILGSGCQIEKLYLVNNGLADTVTIKNTSGTGIAIPAGKSMFVFNDGTNVVDAINYLSSLTVGTLNGVIKGTTGVLSAATAGTDYVAPGTATTFTALQTFAGTASNADLKTSNIIETATISATAATGTIAYDTTTQSVLYYTSNASANWTVNFRGSSGTSQNTIMATGESMSVTFLVTNGTTAYYNSAVQVDGTTSGVTTRWQGGTAPTSGNASSIDSYTYVIIKTGSATFTVLAAQTRFA